MKTNNIPDTRQVIHVEEFSHVRAEELEDGDILYSWSRSNATDSRGSDIVQQVKKSYLNRVENEIRRAGPRRVMVDEDGTAVPPANAAHLNIIHNVVFIRNDNWSLAAPLHLWERAEDTWLNHWVGVMTRTVLGPWDTKPYGVYKELMGLARLVVEARELVEPEDVEIWAEKIAMEVANY